MFDSTKHTDFENNYRDAEKTPIASSPVDYDNVKGVSDYPESRVSLQSTTQFLHNKEKGAKYGLDVFGDSFKKDSKYLNKIKYCTAQHLNLSLKVNPTLNQGI